VYINEHEPFATYFPQKTIGFPHAEGFLSIIHGFLTLVGWQPVFAMLQVPGRSFCSAFTEL